MALQRRIGLGITLGVDAVLNSSNYQTLGAVVNAVKNSGTKADVADISILSDTWKQFGKGQIDPGEYDFEIAYDPGDNTANTNTTVRLQTMHAMTGVNAYSWQLTLPAIPGPGTNAAQTINFSAHVTSLGVTFEKDKMIVAPVKLKVTGNPNL